MDITHNRKSQYSGSNTFLSSWQVQTYTINVIQGTGPFTVELFNVTGNVQQGTNVIVQKGGTNTITFTTKSTTNANVFQYNAIATELWNNS